MAETSATIRKPATAEQHFVDDEKLDEEHDSEDAIEKEIGERIEPRQSLRLSRLSSRKSSHYAPMSQVKIVNFRKDDPDEPSNWSSTKKLYVLLVAIVTVLNSTIGSSLATGVTDKIGARFGVTNDLVLILPTSIYIAGYTIGSPFFGPMSEHYGRKPVMTIAFFVYTVFAMASALAPNFAALVIFRFICGVAGACPITVVGGLCADVYRNPSTRGTAMAVFMAATTWGPCAGPIMSGYIGTISWEWPFWLGLILAGASWPPLLGYRESYSPTILKHRAAKLRKETGDESYRAPAELDAATPVHILTVVLLRGVNMLFTEPLVGFACLYLSLVYTLFYIFLQSYPIIFSGVYNFNHGQVGLAFIPIGIGAIIACFFYLWYDAYLRRAQALDKAWSKNEEYRRLPLACAAGPFIVISLFWSGFTATVSIHWIVPCLSGLSFGIGYLLLFMALLNYLVDAYGLYAASAMSAATTSRSLFGAVLPFAAPSMYETLGIRWACGTLGFISMAVAIIPFVFIVFGPRLRRKSPFCEMLRKKEEEERLKEQPESAGQNVEEMKEQA